MVGVLPPALLCAALGLLLAFQQRRTLVLATIVLVAIALGSALIKVPVAWENAVLWGCWASVIATALALQLPGRLPSWLAVGLAANGGLWVGAIIALTGNPIDLAIALPWVLLGLPAKWLLTTPLRLGVKVIAGWLVAVAILAAAVPLVPTPGYKSDHRE